MGLKINLAAGESLMVGRARIQNTGSHKCTLLVSGDEHILRENRILLEQEATTPVKRLYFVVQGIYLSDGDAKLFPLYHELARTVVKIFPDMTVEVTDVSLLILGGRYYEALNKAHALIDQETQKTEQLIQVLKDAQAEENEHADALVKEAK